ncbi:chitobiase/beta-hexosaminidase C-terminal domain-containing protein [Spirochaeta lutea]|uniref:GH29D-like beta-sandwich domain-containing protein n=1 Tax=Spirochaeta lutea TaxID=1480694 RepID=A0A098QU41_9SPIO|nr:chitobiase/beta-hexosaminidase C-terminal domain-containing protein [Spirochaeta lutea]KGE70898.1 hypothetical protein DC28_13195 [Spirochaeta lutea]
MQGFKRLWFVTFIGLVLFASCTIVPPPEAPTARIEVYNNTGVTITLHMGTYTDTSSVPTASTPAIRTGENSIFEVDVELPFHLWFTYTSGGVPYYIKLSDEDSTAVFDLDEDKNYILILGASSYEFYEKSIGDGDEIPDPTQVKTPVISPASGTFTEAQTVSITTDTTEATIYYTTDGSTPDSTDTEYSTPFTLDILGTTTVKAIAVVDGMVASEVATATIVIELPSIDVGAALEDIVYDAANDKVYAIDYYNKEVVIIDLNTKAVESQTSLTYKPVDLTYDSENNRLFIMNWGSSFVTEFDLDTKTVTQNIPFSSTPHSSVDPDSSDHNETFHIQYVDGILYIVDCVWAPSLHAIDLSENSVTDYTASGIGIGDLAFTAAGNAFYSWYQYGWGAGYAGSDVQKYAIGPDGLTETGDSEIGYPGMARDPLDSPIFLDESEAKIFAKTRVFDAASLQSVYYDFGEVIYAIDQANKRIASKTTVFEYDTYNEVAKVTAESIDQMFFDSSGTLWMLTNEDAKLYYQNIQ